MNIPELLLSSRLFVGVAFGAVSLTDQWTQRIDDPAKALEIARSLSAEVWRSLDEIAPGGLSDSIKVHLVVSGRNVRSVVVYGMQDPQYHAWLDRPLRITWRWNTCDAPRLSRHSAAIAG